MNFSYYGSNSKLCSGVEHLIQLPELYTTLTMAPIRAFDSGLRRHCKLAL